MTGEFLPLRTLALDQILGLFVLDLHFLAHLLEADAQRLLVHEEGHAVALVMHFERRAVLDGALDAVIAEVAFLLAVIYRPEIAVRVDHRAVDGRSGEAEAK